MIYSLRGALIHKEIGTAVIECAGVGYKCTVTFNTLKALPEVGEEAFLYTHMIVREDNVELVGFSKIDEMNCFKLLTSVSGVGAKVGIAILSELTPENVAVAVASNDVKTITRAQGVGNKLAQRIILELKDKIINEFKSGNSNEKEATQILSSGNVQNAVTALTVLGYSPADITPVISQFDADLSVEDLIKLTLREFGRKQKR